MSAVLESPPRVAAARTGSDPDSPKPAGETSRVADGLRVLVDCSVCGSTHGPGTATDPGCHPTSKT